MRTATTAAPSTSDSSPKLAQACCGYSICRRSERFVGAEKWSNEIVDLHALPIVRQDLSRERKRNPCYHLPSKFARAYRPRRAAACSHAYGADAESSPTVGLLMTTVSREQHNEITASHTAAIRSLSHCHRCWNPTGTSNDPHQCQLL